MTNPVKLLFAFATLWKEKMNDDYLASPRELITGVKQGEKRSVMVTFSLRGMVGMPVNIYTSVYKEGKEEELDLEKYETYNDTLRSSILSDGTGVFLMTIEVPNVHFENDGIYEVNVKLFPSDKPLAKGNEIDSIHSYFYALTEKDL